MTTVITLILLSLLCAAPGLWLALRQDGRAISLAGAAALLILATASAYTGLRLWAEQRAATPAPFTHTAAPGHFQTIKPEQLDAALAASAGRPVLLEFYADWCPSCLVWKQEVFSRADVQAALVPVVLLKVDATELTPDVQAMLEQYGLAGLPALLVFDTRGEERPALRLLGEMSAPDFITWINEKLLPAM